MGNITTIKYRKIVDGSVDKVQNDVGEMKSFHFGREHSMYYTINVRWEGGYVSSYKTNLNDMDEVKEQLYEALEGESDVVDIRF